MPSRVIRSTLRQDLATLDKQVKAELRKELTKQGKYLLEQFQDIVSDWKHKPNFRLQVRIQRNRMTITVFAQGQNADIWKYVDEGTKAHVIRPKGKKPLRFKGGYVPRTTPIAEYGGLGKATGNWTSAKQVYHPGTKAREFTVTIGDEFQPLFSSVIENVFRRIVRRVM